MKEHFELIKSLLQSPYLYETMAQQPLKLASRAIVPGPTLYTPTGVPGMQNTLQGSKNPQDEHHIPSWWPQFQMKF